MTLELDDCRFEADDHIAILTLDRPDARNAYSQAMIASMLKAFDHVEADDDIRVLVITGEGSAFSAGGDLKLMRDHAGMFAGEPAQLREGYLDGIHQIPRRLERFRKPLVGAINGHAIGAGLYLACMCDIRVGSRRAKFGSTFVKLGLIPGDGGAYFLARAIGFSRALELVLTGRIFEAVEAEKLGLLHEMVEPSFVREKAMEYAKMLAANPPIAVRLAKDLAYRSREMSAGDALNLAATYQGIAQNTADHDEGVAAMLEKRDPEFRGE
jgi:enoyl-CoA hydratase/carnithine racemase